jgi:hypothetical protein
MRSPHACSMSAIWRPRAASFLPASSRPPGCGSTSRPRRTPLCGRSWGVACLRRRARDRRPASGPPQSAKNRWRWSPPTGDRPAGGRGLRDGVQQDEVTDVSMKPYRCGPEPRLDQLVGIRFTFIAQHIELAADHQRRAAPWLLYRRLQWRGGGLLPRGLRRGRYWFQNHFMASPGEEMPGGEELVGWGMPRKSWKLRDSGRAARRVVIIHISSMGRRLPVV